MAFTGYSVRTDKDGKEWFRQDGTEDWFHWNFKHLDELHVSVEKVFGAPEWPEPREQP